MEFKEFEIEFNQESQHCIDWMLGEFSKLTSGRVNSNLFANIKVDVYGSMLPLNQNANIQTVDARQVLIKPYDRSLIKNIASAIDNLKLNATAQINPDNIRLLFAPLTEESRLSNVKKAKNIYEQAKVKIRNIRQDIHTKIKKISGISEDTIRNYEDDLNKITKQLNNKLDELFNAKERELMVI